MKQETTLLNLFPSSKESLNLLSFLVVCFIKYTGGRGGVCTFLSNVFRRYCIANCSPVSLHVRTHMTLTCPSCAQNATLGKGLEVIFHLGHIFRSFTNFVQTGTWMYPEIFKCRVGIDRLLCWEMIGIMLC